MGTMVSQAKIIVTAGDLKIDVSGATVEVDARLIQMRHDDTWSIVLQRLRVLEMPPLTLLLMLLEMSGFQSEDPHSAPYSKPAPYTRSRIKSLQPSITFATLKKSKTVLLVSSINCSQKQKLSRQAISACTSTD